MTSLFTGIFKTPGVCIVTMHDGRSGGMCGALPLSLPVAPQLEKNSLKRRSPTLAQSPQQHGKNQAILQTDGPAFYSCGSLKITQTFSDGDGWLRLAKRDCMG